MLIADQNRLVRIRAPYVTAAAIIACVFAFLIDGALPDWLAFMPARIQADPGDARGWAALVTYALLHVDLLHLFGNMLALWVFGDNVEDALGHRRYALFLALCAAAGALAWAPGVGPGTALIGASAAVSGVMAAYLLLYPRARIVMLAVAWLPLKAPASWFVGLWVVADVVNAAGLVAPPETEVPTAWTAHLGGFAAGLALTLVARPAGVRLFQPGPAGDAPEGWVMRHAIDLAPRGAGDPWTRACVFKALLFLVIAGAALVFGL